MMDRIFSPFHKQSLLTQKTEQTMDEFPEVVPEYIQESMRDHIKDTR